MKRLLLLLLVAVSSPALAQAPPPDDPPGPVIVLPDADKPWTGFDVTWRPTPHALRVVIMLDELEPLALYRVQTIIQRDDAFIQNETDWIFKSLYLYGVTNFVGGYNFRAPPDIEPAIGWYHAKVRLWEVDVNGEEILLDSHTVTAFNFVSVEHVQSRLVCDVVRGDVFSFGLCGLALH